MAARQTPKVGYDTLRDPNSDNPIQVGTDSWFKWLEEHKSFHYECTQGKFTACKEQRPSGSFWYANRRVKKKLRRTYIGATADLTLNRLQEISQKLDGSDLTYWGHKLPDQNPLKPEVLHNPCVTINKEDLGALEEDRKQMQYLEGRNKAITFERDQLAAEIKQLRSQLEERSPLPDLENALDRYLAKLKRGKQAPEYKRTEKTVKGFIKELLQ